MTKHIISLICLKNLVLYANDSNNHDQLQQIINNPCNITNKIKDRITLSKNENDRLRHKIKVAQGFNGMLINEIHPSNTLNQ